MSDDAQEEAALALLGLSPATTIPKKRKQPPEQPHIPLANSDSISCICGIPTDDGFSIACDVCERWCHAACFDIVHGNVPEEFRCWVCLPRTAVDKDRAVRLQTAKQSAALVDGDSKANGRRRSSPGMDRKRRASGAIDGLAGAAAVVGGGAGSGGGVAVAGIHQHNHHHSNNSNNNLNSNSKRKRRVSINVNTTNLPLPRLPPSSSHSQPLTAEDEHIDIDEPWTQQYVPASHNHVPSRSLREKLRLHAQHWRGLSALQHPTSPLSPHSTSTPLLLAPHRNLPRTAIHPLPPPHIPHANANVLPPSYSLRILDPVPSSTLIKEYISTVTATATYLADPLNAYAGLGMPKPFVHLLGPPLDVALDARVVGSEARFARNGCRPNAVIRPTICPPRGNGDEDDEDEEDDEHKRTALRFAIFALRDLKENEEVVLGWEWDDNHAVHQLPAVIECPHMFPPQHIQQLRAQMTHVLHALGSTFTTCACGARAKDCALSAMARFVDGEFTNKPPSAAATTSRDVGMDATGAAGTEADGVNARGKGKRGRIDLGPLVGVKRGFGTRERVPFGGGFGGVEMMCDDDDADREAGEDQGGNAGPSGTRREGGGDRDGDGAGPSGRGVPLVTFTSPTPSPQKKSASRKGKRISVVEGDDRDNHLATAQRMRNTLPHDNLSNDHLHPDSYSHSHSDARHRPWRRRRRERSSAEDEDNQQEGDGDRNEEEGSLSMMVREALMPPRMRKRWMHEAFKGLVSARGEKERRGQEGGVAVGEGRRGRGMGDMMEVDEAMTTTTPIPSMPGFSIGTGLNTPLPPHGVPAPSPCTPLDRYQTSPLASFSRLSLLSPILPGALSPSGGGSGHTDMTVFWDGGTAREEEGEGEEEEREKLSASVRHTPNGQRPRSPVDASSSSEGGDQHQNPFISIMELPAHSMEEAQKGSWRPELESLSASASPNLEPPAGSSHVAMPWQASFEPPASPIIVEESIADEERPPSPTRATTPPLPPQPKVKLSLKAFALRKKKQREEEMMAAARSITKDVVGETRESPGDAERGHISPFVGDKADGDDGNLGSMGEENQHADDNEASPRAAACDYSHLFTTLGDSRQLEHVNEGPMTPDLTPVLPAVTTFRSLSPWTRSDVDASLTSRNENTSRDASERDFQASFPYPKLKVEPVDRLVFNRPTGDVGRASTPPSLGAQKSLNGSSRYEESRDEPEASLPTPPLASDPRFSQRRPSLASQEDGEILGSTPPRHLAAAMPGTSPWLTPRSHTPPTQPRSFHTPCPSPSSQAKRPSLPPAYRPSIANGSPNANASARPLPSGPRALRGMSNSSVHPSPRTFSSPAVHSIPRGPSADRDRYDRDRDWREWQGRQRGRGPWGQR